VKKLSHDVSTRPINVSRAFGLISALDHRTCPNVSLILNVHGAHIVRRVPILSVNVSLIMVSTNVHVKGVIVTGSDGKIQRVPTCPNVSGTRSRQPCPVSLSRREGHDGHVD
jgi:hypothetical protein